MAYDNDTQYMSAVSGGGVPKNFFATNNGSAPGPLYTAEWAVTPEQLASVLAGRNGNSAYGPYADHYRYDGTQTPPDSLSAPSDGLLSRVQVPMGQLDTSGPRYTQMPASMSQNTNSRNDPGGGGGGLPALLRTIAPLAPLVAGRLQGGSGAPGVNTQMPPELQQLLAQAMRRMADQEGLFQSVTAQAKAGLPTAYQR